LHGKQNFGGLEICPLGTSKQPCAWEESNLHEAVRLIAVSEDDREPSFEVSDDRCGFVAS